MVSLYASALKVVQNPNLSKLIKQNSIEDLLAEPCAIDQHFQILKDSYLSIAPRHSKLFQHLENEQYLLSLNLSDTIKTYRQIVNYKKALPLASTFQILTDKLTAAQQDQFTPDDLAKVIQSFLKFRVLPSNEFLKWIGKVWTWEGMSQNYGLNVYMTRIYCDMRLEEIGKYEELDAVMKRVMNRDLKESMMKRKDGDVFSVIDIAKDLCHAEEWQYKELWKCIFEILAQKLTFSSNLPAKEAHKKLGVSYILSILRTLDGLSTFSPDILSLSKQHIDKLTPILTYTSLDLIRSETSSHTESLLSTHLSSLNTPFQPSQIIEKYYKVDFLIPPSKIIECHGIYHYLRTTQNQKTQIEDASTLFKEKLLKAKGYEYLKIPYYEYSSTSSEDLQTKISNYILK